MFRMPRTEAMLTGGNDNDQKVYFLILSERAARKLCLLGGKRQTADTNSLANYSIKTSSVDITQR